MKQKIKKAWAAWKEQRKARRVARFKAQFAEAYPDAAQFIARLAWLDGTDDFIINGKINVPDVLIWTPPTHEEIGSTDY